MKKISLEPELLQRQTWVRELPHPADRVAIITGGKLVADAVVARHLAIADIEGREWIDFLAEAHGLGIKRIQPRRQPPVSLDDFLADAYRLSLKHLHEPRV